MYNMQSLSFSFSPFGWRNAKAAQATSCFVKTVGGKSRCSEIHRLSGKEGEGELIYVIQEWLLVRWLLF